MNKTLSRVLWIIAGVLLIVAGVYCFVSFDAALSGLSLILGLAMLFSGIVDIVIFASSRRFMLGSGWFLLDGIFTVLLAIFLLCNQAFTMLSLPFIFGMWLLFGGISRFVSSFDLQRLGVRGWGWFTALGILLTVAGILSFYDPISGAMALSWIVGLVLIYCMGLLLRALLEGLSFIKQLSPPQLFSKMTGASAPAFLRIYTLACSLHFYYNRLAINRREEETECRHFLSWQHLRHSCCAIISSI